MDSFELNKLIGAFLGVVFVVFSVSLVSDALFASHSPETPGYAIEVPDEPAAGGAPADAGPSALDLLATADPAAGESAFRRCASCHTVDSGGANRVGPNLWGVVGRVVAEHEGFSYSAAMETYSEGATKTWEFENLSHFLVNPRSYISGTTMAFAGIRDPQEEANLIAYLNQQSDNPLPLPEPAAAEDEAAGDEAAPAEGEEAAPAEGEEAAPATDEAAPADEGTAPAENGDAAPADEAAPAENGAAAPADEAAPAEDNGAATEAAPQTEAAPAEPTEDQDGTAASPEPDAGQPAADGEVTDEEPRAPAQN
ncbi:c-type cytochrome [Aliihoeflea aestuarii]|jgi:cytochrome c|uniref:c-type cytochrome n=1 Tax=Aliihoeflea aestuarii TaxID=453840 RepID=UPI0027E23D71|nr:cytochrome c family protein [Aliihoeflea aestuarii]MCO6391448.1 c-type cytochrome [Aliihoeflea aestuarii]